jgi:hypothetical protein
MWRSHCYDIKDLAKAKKARNGNECIRHHQLDSVLHAQSGDVCVDYSGDFARYIDHKGLVRATAHGFDGIGAASTEKVKETRARDIARKDVENRLAYTCEGGSCYLSWRRLYVSSTQETT